MLDKLKQVEDRYEELCARAEQPDFYADPKKAAAWLREHGVNYLQGYWIGRPMPLEQFRTWQPDITLGE